MSKGSELGKLLEQGEVLHAQMRQLFIKNNVNSMNLEELPEDDRKEWYRLQALTEKLTEYMCSIISSSQTEPKKGSHVPSVESIKGDKSKDKGRLI